jgi:nucleoside-diphosphate-sugar epimerase
MHALGWTATVDLSDGIERTVEWFRANVADQVSDRP